jgi:16S rRNA (guanine1207-N2)-methyltransferase
MHSQYQLKLRSQESNKIYSFESADGINSKNSFREEELLLADEADILKQDSILVIQSGFGFLGTVLGDKAQSVTIYDVSARAAKFSERNAGNNNIKNFRVENTAEILEIEQDFDKIVYAPSDYTPVDLVKQRLSQAVDKLKDSGEILIAGKKKSGLRRHRDFLKKFGNEEKLGKRGKIKAYSFSDLSKPEEIDLETTFTAELRDIEADFVAAEGLFSSGKLDEGTRILLENIELEKPDKVLDVGCGYGAISVFLSKKYDANLFLTDDNARAVKYAGRNLENNGVEDFKLKIADCLDGFQDEKFDVIVSNPPTHQGRGITTKIFSQTAERLVEQGQFWLVYNKNMRFEGQLSNLFNSVEVVAEESNFLVVRAVK